MSEISGDRKQSHGGMSTISIQILQHSQKTLLSFFSKGSSVSIFSAEGISSASGTSEVGHVIVDELSDNSLNNLVEETAKTVRRMNLETRMFEGMSPYIFMRIKKSHHHHLRKKKNVKDVPFTKKKN